MNKQTEILTLLPETILIDEKLGAIDLPTLLSVCVDLLTICVRRSAEIDPAVAAMVAYVRDEVREHVSNDRSLGRSWSPSAPQTTGGALGINYVPGPERKGLDVPLGAWQFQAKV
jgi:hypothetical protein